MRSLLALTLVFVMAACGDASEPPPAPATVAAAITVRPAQPINLVIGDSMRVEIDAVDVHGKWVATPAISWRSTNASSAIVAATGFVRGLVEGEGWIVASAANVKADSVFVRVRPISDTYHITLLYAADVPQKFRDAFESAARRWEQVIVGALPPVTLNSAGGDCPTPPGEPASPPLNWIERGTIIYIGMSGKFPAGTFVEAVGGPCIQRPLPFPTTIIGSITVNRDKPVDNILPDRLRYLAVHEMGHVLGLVGVVQGIQPSWYSLATGAYTGSMALEGWRRVIGVTPSVIYSRSGAHWDPSSVDDVMNAAGLADEISFVSVGALLDMGYPATWLGAGSYF